MTHRQCTQRLMTSKYSRECTSYLRVTKTDETTVTSLFSRKHRCQNRSCVFEVVHEFKVIRDKIVAVGKNFCAFEYDSCLFLEKYKRYGENFLFPQKKFHSGVSKCSFRM